MPSMHTPMWENEVHIKCTSLLPSIIQTINNPSSIHITSIPLWPQFYNAQTRQFHSLRAMHGVHYILYLCACERVSVCAKCEEGDHADYRTKQMCVLPINLPYLSATVTFINKSTFAFFHGNAAYVWALSICSVYAYTQRSCLHEEMCNRCLFFHFWRDFHFSYQARNTNANVWRH